MAILRRSPDHSIWYKHIDDPQNALLPHLKDLAGGQSVVLRVGQSTGIWIRFNSGHDGKPPEALKCGDEASKDIWRNLPRDGSPVEIALVEVLSQASTPSKQSFRRSSTPVALEAIGHRVQGSVLCLAVDVAWWGGQTGRGKKSTRTETIAYASRDKGKWSELSLKRVHLNSSYNPKADPFTPNADADASTLIAGIKQVLDAHSGITNIVLAVDMPILANDEGMAPPRKANERGAKGGKYRQCDLAWMAQRERSPIGWRNVNIFTGAPIVPRVRALIEKLRHLGFEVYGQGPMAHDRLIFECFPNEVVWSIGVLGFADGLKLDSLQLYKRLGKKGTPVPHDVFDGLWKHTVGFSLDTAGVDATCRTRWLEDVDRWLSEDGVFDAATDIGQTGKQFDDAVDSVLSLSAAASFVLGTAHIHQGIDPEDGHIIGPGNAARVTLASTTQ